MREHLLYHVGARFWEEARPSTTPRGARLAKGTLIIA